MLRNQQGRFLPTKPLDVRTEADAKHAEKLIQIGPITMILIHADWCGHCQTYKPLWKTFEDMNDRTANIVQVHHDMVENMPTIANAKIKGYPSVIKVLPNGTIETYKDDAAMETNAMPEMRNEERMRKEMTQSKEGTLSRVDFSQKGGAFSSVSSAFLSAFQRAAPASLLLAAYETTARRKTFKSPKKSGRRASTRKNRTRKN